eukprot:COSAG04_NODE_5832_length_1480_cov_8.383056_1_plen_134_part_10
MDPDAIRYGVDLKPTTRKKINEGVKKAIRLAHILGIHAEDEERKKEERKKLVGPQVADKADHDKEMDQVLEFLDKQLEKEASEGTKGVPEGAVKVSNPLANMGGPDSASDDEDEDIDPTTPPSSAAKGAASLFA